MVEMRPAVEFTYLSNEGAIIRYIELLALMITLPTISVLLLFTVPTKALWVTSIETPFWWVYWLLFMGGLEKHQRYLWDYDTLTQKCPE